MQSLLDPAVLFFALGVFAGLVRSNLEMPAAISKFLSIYLLMALGLKGGFALAASGFTASVASSLGLAVLLAVVVPWWVTRCCGECCRASTRRRWQPPMARSAR